MRRRPKPSIRSYEKASDDIKSLDEQLAELDTKFTEFVAALPNLPDDDIVAGGKENNEVVKVFGEKQHLTLKKRTM